MSTKLFKAINRLHGNLRWCLTGTPIQNSLQDLVSLFEFIQCHPLNNKHVFKKHVINPLMRGSENSVEKLRQVLDFSCLRRTKELLNLPDIIHKTRLLTFSAEEKKQYEDTRQRLTGLIKKQQIKPHEKGYISPFHLLLQLRRVCNHGTFQAAEEFDPKERVPRRANRTRVVEERCCQNCKKNLIGNHDFQSQHSGSLTVCGHLVCFDCVPKLKEEFHRNTANTDFQKFSICDESITGKQVGKTHSGKGQYFDRSGFCTKVLALLEDIQSHETEEKR